nr:transposase [Bacteroides intestinalis]
MTGVDYPAALPVIALKINRQRWEIEENFRIMKTDFEARPVYVRREDRIKTHFLTCYISLLEKKWETNIPVTRFSEPFVPCR